MIGPTNKAVKAAANAVSSVGSAAGAAASVGAAVEKTVIGTSDDYQVKHKITPEKVNNAFDRLEKAEGEAKRLSLGTLGMLPMYKKALAEVKSIQDEIDTMRKMAPDVVKGVEADRAAESAEKRKGFFDGFFKAIGWVVAPLPMLAHTFLNRNK